MCSSDLVVLVLALRYPLNTALTVGAGLAQIGEFSFILASLGLSLGLLPTQGQSLILAAAMLSIALNAALFGVLSPLLAWAREHSDWARRMESRDDPLAQLPDHVPAAVLEGQVVLVGQGAVGQALLARLQGAGMSPVVAAEDRARVEQLRAEGTHAVAGDLMDPATLIQAHVAKAVALVVTLPDPVLLRKLVQDARTLRPGLPIWAWAASAEEAQALRTELAIEALSPDQAWPTVLGEALAESMKAVAVVSHGH